ncbi:MAG: TonB-dependent receptor [Bacteroidota bacterium]
MKPLVIFTFLLLSCVPGTAQIQGRVVDENREPLPGAHLLLLPDSLHCISKADGRFEFWGLPDGKYRIEFRFLGYQSQQQKIELHNGTSPFLRLQVVPAPQTLETLVVSEEHAKQEETLQADHLDLDFFEENVRGTFAKSIEKLPGISAINVGVGIAKPVIRGLSANRIIVNHQGIKQEGQQWGSDHGLEIDPFDVERVEIIKGPGALQYGSDGLGGVINIQPGKLLPKHSIDGSVLGVYKSNNAHWGGSARLGINWNDVFLIARYSHQNFADYRVPTETFTYNSFTLPILDERLKNTAGREANFTLAGGISRPWGITRLLFSRYSLEAGLFSGAVGIPRSYRLDDDGNPRDIDVPRQSVQHERVSLNQTFFFGANHLRIDVGYQRNLRQEYSVPEFHSIPSSRIDPNDQLALEFELETYSVAVHYEHRLGPTTKSTHGFNAQWQRNLRGGFEFLLPDFRTSRAGAFSLWEKQMSDRWLINGGLRLDYAENQTSFYRQFVWDSNENITDSLVAPLTDDGYFNWSASVGTNLTLRDGQWVLKANLGKSFRVPYPAETVSNGIHHGTFRHEIGTPDLSSEQGYQLDLSADGRWTRVEASLALYFNYFDNYIYLGPTFPARFSPLPEAGQIFQYRQDDAIYTGVELYWKWELLSFLSLKQAVDFVQSYNPRTRLALPFTPQPAIRTDLRWAFAHGHWLEEAHLELGHQYHFAATGNLRIDRSENQTPAYSLWEVGVGADFLWHRQPLRLSIQVQNLMDTFYLAHLSRYRLLNIPEQGRNWVLTLKLPFSGKLTKA